MRILYVTTVGITMTFFRNFVRSLLDDGHVVDIATNENGYPVPECYKEWGCKIYPISTSRSPFSFGNVKAIKQIRSIAKDYDIVHCHTPLAGMATRLACKRLRKKNGLKVIYTAHGFHFYKGAPKKNWMIYYPIEKFCSKYTDILVTINLEDYELAKKKFKTKKVEYVHGVGIDINKYVNTKVDFALKRQEIGVPENAKMILSVGELNANKNHRLVIEALGKLSNPDIHYVIAGEGAERENLLKVALKNNVNIHLLGFRTDVHELYKIANLFIHPSFREGLPVSLMEAIASKTDSICSIVRGCNDLVHDGLFSPYSVDDTAETIKQFLINGKTNKDDNFVRLASFDIKKVNAEMFSLYEVE